MSRLLCLTELLRLANAARVPDLRYGSIGHVSILGTRVLRTEDPRFLTAGGICTDDMRLPGACHVHFVRSAVAPAAGAAGAAGRAAVFLNHPGQT